MLVPKEISGSKNMAPVKTIRIILDLKFKFGLLYWHNI